MEHLLLDASYRWERQVIESKREQQPGDDDEASVVALRDAEKEVDGRVALGDRTRTRIIDAAEALFAHRGYDAVSLRDIIAAAGVNSAAIYYHFRSKEALLLSILRTRGASIAAARMKNLAALKARGDYTLRNVLTAFLKPALEDRNGITARSHYANIRVRMSTERQTTVLSIQGDVFDESTRAFLAVLHELLPHLPQRELYFRFDFMLGLMLHAMSNNGRIDDVSRGEVSSSDPDEMLARLVPFIEAGFRA